MGKYFGTDGFRGKANEGLTASHAYEIGRFLGWYYSRHGRAQIVVGKDTRRSCYMLEYALAAGLTTSGADAYMLHVTTTPSVAYVTRTEDFDCGIMISASHNPYCDNGIKLLNRQGEKMEERTIAKIEEFLEVNRDLPYARRENIGRTVDHVAGRNRYIGYLISLGLYSFKGLKIGLDCANGAAWNIARSVFEALGAKTFVINASPNGLNINHHAGSTHMEGLRKWVLEKGLDAGFAYDGDGDRCLCVDEKGNILSGDHILYILGCHMRRQGQLDSNTVVTTVMSNLGLYKALDAQSIGYAKTAVGDKYVYAHMAANRCCLGGEQSGHIIISKYATTGDGILTSLKIMEVMLAEKKKLSELAAELVMYPQITENVPVISREKAMADPSVKSAVASAAERLGNTGRILVRPSGTEPVIRILAEAPEIAACEECVRQVIDAIRAGGHLAV